MPLQHKTSALGLIADPPLMRPGVSTIAKAGKGALRPAGATLRPSLQPGVAAYADGVLQAEKLAEFIEQLGGETSVSA